jgi:hypothetical protein
MKKSIPAYTVFACIACIIISCGSQQHKREERKIENARRQEELQTADLSDAIKVTDEAGWDSVASFRLFRDSAAQRLAADKATLDTLKAAWSNRHRKVPLRYRERIRHLESRIAELERRPSLYNKKGKAAWDDFTALYYYDLKLLDQDIAKVAKKRAGKTGKGKPR